MARRGAAAARAARGTAGRVRPVAAAA